MYENMEVEDIKSNIVGKITTDIDVREGSFTNDMISAVAYEIWKTYQALDGIIPIAYINEASGEYIDKRCAEYGITRKPGTKAVATLHFTGGNGIVIPEGKVFLTVEGREFITDKMVTILYGTASVTATASDIGEEYNVEAGAITGQYANLSGLSTVTNEVATGGSNAETDAALVARFYNHLQKPATSGNIAHYRQWALEVNGIGNAKVMPLWDGPGTVKVLVVGNGNEPVDSTIVTKCAERIEEYRPIGAEVTVISAEGLDVNISASISIDSSTTKEIVLDNFKEALEDYLRSIAFTNYTVVYNRIAYILLDIKGVVDYSELTVNGEIENVAIGSDQVPILGTVVIS